MLVLEGADRVGEIDAALPEIRGGLAWVPFDGYSGALYAQLCTGAKVAANGPEDGSVGRVSNLPSVGEIREKTGLSQARFAALLGVSVRTLQEREQGCQRAEGKPQVE